MRTQLLVLLTWSAAVDRVFIVGGISAATVTTNVTRTTPAPGALRVVEGRPVSLRCVALGGYPPPSIDLYVGGHDVTTHLAFSNSASLTAGGMPGMRHIYIRSERSTDSFTATAANDGSQLRCVVTVPGSTPHVDSVLLEVHCKIISAFVDYVLCKVICGRQRTIIFYE